MINKLFKKYKDIILYLVFGVLTTLVNIVTYWISAHILMLGTTCSTVIGWILSVLFAYVTNRKWVFESKASSNKEIIKEITSFFGCRLSTGLLDIANMFIFVDCLAFNDLVIKILSNVVVVIINYVASKFLIFKKEEYSMKGE